MKLTFILGPAGSGKTKYCLDQIEEELRRSPEGPPLIFLVPDQMTYQTEKVVLKSIPGFMRLYVVSFRRLAWRVLDEVGGRGASFITATGKTMAIQSILWRRGQDLRFFAPSLGRPGFSRVVSRTIHELMSWNVSPEDLERTARIVEGDFAGSFLSLKLKDIALVYDEYLKFIEGRFTDPDDYLSILAQKVPQSFVKGARVWVDGFSGFTPKEYEVLRALLEVAHEVNVALCMDPAELLMKPDETRVFYPTRRVLEKLREIAAEMGVNQVTAVGLERGSALPGVSGGESLEPPVVFPLDRRGHTGGNVARYDVRDALLKSMSAERLRGTPPRFGASPELSTLERWLRARDYPVDICLIRTGTSGLPPGEPASGRSSAGEDPGAGQGDGRDRGPAAGQGFTGDAGNAGSSGTTGDIVLVRASNPRAEVEACAREIVRMVRDEGYRFGEISVELRDLQGSAGIPYTEIIRTVFRDYGIPFFIDEKRPVTHHPLVELVRSALDVVVSGWASDAVLSYLKNDLVPVSRGDVDAIENYVLARGIKGSSWFSGRSWDTLDSIKNKAIAELRRFCEKIQSQLAGVTARYLSQTLVELLRDLEVTRTLERWRDEALKIQDLEEAMYHSGVWAGVLEVLSQAREILGDQVVSVEEYSSIVLAGLEDLRIGLIPPAVDQVLVGSLERSRQPDPKATFLLGAFQGAFPRRHEDDAVFSDRERDKISGAGLEIDVSSRQKQLFEKYLCYIALTRPSHRLWISYPLGDSEGRTLSPSSVVLEIKRLFPGKAERYEGPDPPGEASRDLDWIVPGRVLGTLARRLSGVREKLSCGKVWIEVYRWFLSGPHREKAIRVLRSLGYSNNPGKLSREIATKLYGSPVVTSVSRLERYSRCPFYHFAADGLGLEEREIFVLEPATAGSLLHLALKELVDAVAAKGLKWSELTRDEAVRLAREVFAQVLERPESEIFRSSSRYRYVSTVLERAAVKAAETLVEHIGQGAFRPAAAELRFGFEDGVEGLEIPLGDGEALKLRGIIDRIDVAEDETGRYVRVVDYKSGGMDLNIDDVLHGLSLQLMVYLLVATLSVSATEGATGQPGMGVAVEKRAAGDRPVPAGAFYFRVLTPVKREKVPPVPDPSSSPVLKNRKMRGLVVNAPEILSLMERERNSGPSRILPLRYLKSGGVSGSVIAKEDMENLLKFVEEKVRELGRGIIEGDISIAPYRRGRERACQYCPYGPVCTFDILLPGNTYRKLEGLPGEKAFDLVRRVIGERRGG